MLPSDTIRRTLLAHVARSDQGAASQGFHLFQSGHHGRAARTLVRPVTIDLRGPTDGRASRRLDRLAGCWRVVDRHRVRSRRRCGRSNISCLARRAGYWLSAGHPSCYYPSAYRGGAGIGAVGCAARRTGVSFTCASLSIKLHSIALKCRAWRRWRRDDHRAHHRRSECQPAGPLQDHHTPIQRSRGQRRHNDHHLLDRSADAWLSCPGGRVDQLGRCLHYPVHAAVAHISADDAIGPILVRAPFTRGLTGKHRATRHGVADRRTRGSPRSRRVPAAPLPGGVSHGAPCRLRATRGSPAVPLGTVNRRLRPGRGRRRFASRGSRGAPGSGWGGAVWPSSWFRSVGCVLG